MLRLLKIILEILYFIVLKLHDFQQTVPLELIFNIPVLILSLYASFDFKAFQKFVKYSDRIACYHFVGLLFFLLKFFMNFGTKKDELTNIKLILTSGVILVIVYAINTTFEGRKVELGENILKHDKDSNMTIKWYAPNGVFWLKVFILIYLFTMLFYAHNSINSKTRNRFINRAFIYYIITFIILAANYLCLFRWKWIQFEWLTHKKMEVEGYLKKIRLVKIQVSFHMALYPASKRFSSELCTICQELGPTAHFCSNHCFHESCLVPFLIEKTKIILNEFQIKWVHRRIFGNEIRQRSRVSMTCEIKLKRDNLPSCPNCKQHLDKDIIEIKMKNHSMKKMVSASVKIIG